MINYIGLMFCSYVAYYCIWGTPGEVLRAIKIVYYILNVNENVMLQHEL
jgi:hypothetical protein